jgi:hypothetical protein
VHVAGDEGSAVTSGHQDAQGHHSIKFALGGASPFRELGSGEAAGPYFVCHAAAILSNPLGWCPGISRSAP